MQKFTYFIVILLLLFAFDKMIFAGDFDVHPPIFVQTPEDSEYDDIIDGQIDDILNSMNSRKKGYVPPQTQLDIPRPKMPAKYILRGPSLYFSASYQSENRWFDRRINWSTFETDLCGEYDFFGFKLQAAGSEAGRDEFEIYDARATLYFFTGDNDESNIEVGNWRFGGGLTYFWSDPYKGQSFLKERRAAIFLNTFIRSFELKIAMLFDEDDVWGGALCEFKLINPLFQTGLSVTGFISSLLRDLGGLMFLLTVIFPAEIGVSGSFDLPNNSQGWGWFSRWRLPFVFTTDRLPLHKLSRGFHVGIELFWGYQNGIANTRVTESWEIGIKFFVFGF